MRKVLNQGQDLQTSIINKLFTPDRISLGNIVSVCCNTNGTSPKCRNIVKFGYFFLFRGENNLFPIRRPIRFFRIIASKCKLNVPAGEQSIFKKLKNSFYLPFINQLWTIRRPFWRTVIVPSEGHSLRFVSKNIMLSLIHIWRCRRSYACRSRWSPYH